LLGYLSQKNNNVLTEHFSFLSIDDKKYPELKKLLRPSKTMGDYFRIALKDIREDVENAMWQSEVHSSIPRENNLTLELNIY